MNSSKKTWFAFPYILWIIGFTMIPLGLVLYYAFTSADGGFTLANVLAIAEPVHLKSLWTSIKMAVSDHPDLLSPSVPAGTGALQPELKEK